VGLISRGHDESSATIMAAVKRVPELEVSHDGLEERSRQLDGDKGQRFGDGALSYHVYQQGIESQT
jgi:hypothetical protein